MKPRYENSANLTIQNSFTSHSEKRIQNVPQMSVNALKSYTGITSRELHSSGLLRSEQWKLEMGPTGCPETPVRNYHYSLRKKTEKRSSSLLPARSLKLRTPHVTFYVNGRFLILGIVKRTSYLTTLYHIQQSYER